MVCDRRNQFSVSFNFTFSQQQNINQTEFYEFSVHQKPDVIS